MLKNLELHNFKTIDDFTMEFNGNVYLITGDNELGKSTVINAIFTLLTGDRSDNLLSRGKDKGHIKGEFDHAGKTWIVELKFTEKNKRGKLRITEKGSPFDTDKKSALDMIFGYNDFDVSEFIEWSKTKPGRKKQVELIKSLFPADVQKAITGIDIDIETIVEKRRKKGQEAQTQQAIVKNFKITDEFKAKYAQPIDLQPIKEKIEKAGERNAQIAKVQEGVNSRKEKLDNWDEYVTNELQSYESDITAAEKKVQDLQKQLQEAETMLKNSIDSRNTMQNDLERLFKSESEKLKEHEEWLQTNKPDELKELNSQYETAVEHNSNNKKLLEWGESFSSLTALKEEYNKLDSDIEAKRAERVQLVASNPLPVDGLTFDLDQLYLNDIPFTEDEVSTSQIMETCVRLMIAKNPTCKMFKIGRGESLGSDKFKAIIDFAKKEGYQGFIEEVVRGQQQLNVFEYTEPEKNEQ